MILRKLADHTLALIGANPIRGKVVGKDSYSARQIVSVGPTTIASNVPADVDTWELVIEGKGKFGTILREEIVVDFWTFDNVRVGDKWPT